MRWVTWTLCVVCAVGSPVATAAVSLSIDSAVATAIADNPGLAELQERFAALREVPQQVGTRPDPSLNLGAMNLPTDTFDAGQEAMTQLQIGVSQALPFPGKLALRQQAAEHDAQAAGHSVDEARLQLVQRVKTGWWQLHYIDRALETLARNEALLQQLIEVAKTMYATGKGLQQDVLLAQLELSKLIDQNLQLTAVRRQASIDLNILLAAAPGRRLALSSVERQDWPALRPEDELFQHAEQARPLLRVLSTQVAAAKSRLALAKRDRYPDLMVGMTYGNRSGSNPPPRSGGRTDFLSVMLGVKLPIYAGRKQSRAIAQREHDVQRNRYAMLDQRGLVFGAIASAATDYHRATAQLSLFQSGIVPQAEQTVQSMLAGYQVGEVDFLNLVRSEITLFTYELQYWRAVTEAQQAVARLEAAVGEETIYE